MAWSCLPGHSFLVVQTIDAAVGWLALVPRRIKTLDSARL